MRDHLLGRTQSINYFATLSVDSRTMNSTNQYGNYDFRENDDSDNRASVLVVQRNHMPDVQLVWARRPITKEWLVNVMEYIKKGNSSGSKIVVYSGSHGSTEGNVTQHRDHREHEFYQEDIDALNEYRDVLNFEVFDAGKAHDEEMFNQHFMKRLYDQHIRYIVFAWCDGAGTLERLKFPTEMILNDRETIKLI